jgi:hypothetical protein
VVEAQAVSLPSEEAAAVDAARRFLFDLLNPKVTPRVPKAVRERARRVVKHYPYSVVYFIERQIGERRAK